jgi:hypothetical protein
MLVKSFFLQGMKAKNVLLCCVTDITLLCMLSKLKRAMQYIEMTLNLISPQIPSCF